MDASRLIFVEGIMGSGNPPQHDGWRDCSSVRAFRRKRCPKHVHILQMSFDPCHTGSKHNSHGDFTCLFLMGCGPEVLQQYARHILQLAQPLQPLLIYYYQSDVSKALNRIGAQRGQGWIDSQVAWKVASPYAQQRGYAGSEGWKQRREFYPLTAPAVIPSISVRCMKKYSANSGIDIIVVIAIM